MHACTTYIRDTLKHFDAVCFAHICFTWILVIRQALRPQNALKTWHCPRLCVWLIVCVDSNICDMSVNCWLVELEVCFIYYSCLALPNSLFIFCSPLCEEKSKPRMVDWRLHELSQNQLVWGWNMLRKSAVFVASISLKWLEYPPGN